MPIVSVGRDKLFAALGRSYSMPHLVAGKYLLYQRGIC